MSTIAKIKCLISSIKAAEREVAIAKDKLGKERPALVKEVARYLLKTQDNFNYHDARHQYPTVRIVTAGQVVPLEDYDFANPDRRDFIAEEDYILYSWSQPFRWETNTYAIAFPLREME